MKRARNLVILTTASCVTLALLGCGSDSTAPISTPSHPSPLPAAVPTSIVAISTVSQVGWAGFNAMSAPTIQVLDQNGYPMSNISVSFAVTQGGGSVRTTSTTTGQAGFAATTWILGNQGGPNTVHVSVEALDGISFHADATVPVIVARYDLEEVGGAPLPFQYSHDPSYGITGGHYLIAADNGFAFGYDINGVSNVTPTGTVVRVDATTLKFVISPDPESDPGGNNGLFAQGRIEGNTMLVTYDPEYFHSQVEKYLRRD